VTHKAQSRKFHEEFLKVCRKVKEFFLRPEILTLAINERDNLWPGNRETNGGRLRFMSDIRT